MKRFNSQTNVLVIYLGITLTFGVSGSVLAEAEKEEVSWLRPDTIPAPTDNQITPERVELGKTLFFDPRLSGSKWISCATCHNPALGWSDGLPTAMGHNMEVLGRATPTILNTAYQRLQFWDGRARSLEAQALGPIEDPGEMAGNVDEALAALQQIPGYVAMFEAAYPDEGITADTLAKALATFQRTIVSTESDFDRWQKGDEDAVTDPVKRGFDLFTGKANCDACHQGFNFIDDGFHNLGLKGNQDAGRYAVVPVKVLKGAFKTPTLRDVALTAPYMHNGMYETLEEVVGHYNRGGDVEENLDPNMKPLNLTEQEVKDVVAFLESLTGDPPEITVPALPQ